MSNMFGNVGAGAAFGAGGQAQNQNNPQLMGANIIGVNPGNGVQQDAQALQRASQGQFGAQSMGGLGAFAAQGAGAQGAYGAAGMSAGALGGAMGAAGFAGGASGGQQNNPQLVGANIVGVNPGNGIQQDAQMLQRASQGAYGAQSMGGLAASAAQGAGAFGAAGMGGYGAAGMSAMGGGLTSQGALGGAGIGAYGATGVPFGNGVTSTGMLGSAALLGGSGGGQGGQS